MPPPPSPDPRADGEGPLSSPLSSALARDAAFMPARQHLDAARNVQAAAIMRGDPEPMRRRPDLPM
jgi:hypothetical protein